MLFRSVLYNNGGLTTAVEKLALIPADGATEPGSGMFATWFGPDPWGLLGVIILTSLGTMGLPQMVGKFYSITDESAIKRGTVISPSSPSSWLAAATSSAVSDVSTTPSSMQQQAR